MNQMTVAEFDQRIEAANARMDVEIAALHEKKAVLQDLLERRHRYAEQLEETLVRLKREQFSNYDGTE